MLTTIRKIQAGEKSVVVFLGDSITQGGYELDLKYTRYLSDNDTYHQKLLQRIKEKYPQANMFFHNAGVGGENAEQGYARIQTDVLDMKPDMCVVCFGLNDVPKGLSGIEPYKDALSRIFTATQNAGIETVFLTPNMMAFQKSKNQPLWLQQFSVTTSNLMNNGVMDRYMNAARETAQAFGVPVADGYARWTQLRNQGIDTDSLLCNEINHPTIEGNQILADVLFETLFEG